MYWKLLFVIILLSYTTSCDREHNSDCDCDIMVEKYDFPITSLLESCLDNDTEYCCLLNGVLGKEKGSLKKLTNVGVSDGCSYDHGANMYHILRIMGKDEFRQMIIKDNLDFEEKRELKGLLEVGFLYNHKNSEDSISINTLFDQTLN